MINTSTMKPIGKRNQAICILLLTVIVGAAACIYFELRAAIKRNHSGCGADMSATAIQQPPEHPPLPTIIVMTNATHESAHSAH